MHPSINLYSAKVLYLHFPKKVYHKPKANAFRQRSTAVGLRLLYHISNKIAILLTFKIVCVLNLNDTNQNKNRIIFFLKNTVCRKAISFCVRKRNDVILRINDVASKLANDVVSCGHKHKNKRTTKVVLLFLGSLNLMTRMKCA